MDKAHKTILKKNRVSLVNDLVADEVLQFLVEKEILSDHWVEKVNSKATSFEKNVELLTLLPKRGPTAFQFFVDALNETDQTHLAETLTSNVVFRNNETLLQSISTDCRVENAAVHASQNQVSNFSFPPSASSVSCKVSSSDNLLFTQNVLPKKRSPVENQCSIDVLRISENNAGSELHKKQRTDVDAVDLIPSPCESLADIESTSSMESLASSSCLKMPKTCVSSKKNSSTSLSKSGTFWNTSPLNLSGCDLSDGPTYNDLIVRSSSTSQALDPYDCYDMLSSPRGLALIISVDHFEPSACLDHRQAADVDRSRLEFVLRQLGFRCYKLVDGTGKEIWDVLSKFVALEDHYRCDVSMLVVMSHGEEQCFFGRDGERVYISRVIELFNNEHCKGLQNKPKILLFQCCRGSVIDKGVDESDGKKKTLVSVPEADMASSSLSLCSSITYNKLPTHSDCLVGYATVKGYAAMRNTKHGSWYIQALVRVLAYHACDKHIAEIMTIVNNLIKCREGNSPATEYHRCKEMSVFHSTLCKKLYLFPGPSQM